MAFDGAWSPLEHRGPARRLVAALKFKGAPGIADAMAAAIAARAPEGALDGELLVPVPADPMRQRLRGIDHAALLAAGLAGVCRRPVAPLLRRRGRAAAHTTLSRAQRMASQSPTLHVVKAPPATVVLVDDVHTTGATLDTCARALLDAGCTRVRAVTFCRTLP